MRSFARLYAALDETTATNEKVAALVEYFRSAPPEDAAWAVHFLTGRRPKRLVSGPDLRRWAADEAGVPEWLFEESYQAVGDLAETITLLLPEPAESGEERSLAWWVEERLLPLRGQDPAVQREEMVRAWRELDRRERFVWNKLITGAFRVGASVRLVERALAQASGVEEGAISHRLMGGWEPTPEFFRRLVSVDVSDADVSRPYPFYLAYALEAEPESLGRSRRMAGGVEVGRHPRPADPAHGTHLSLVPRRGAADRAFSGGGRGGGAPSRRHACSTASCCRGSATRRCRSRSCSAGSGAPP